MFALICAAADSPNLVQSLTYVKEPAALPDVLSEKIRYTESGTNLGGLWWWIMAYAEGMAEAIIAGNERPFVDWFYNNYTAGSSAISEQARRVYIRDFEGKEGIAGGFGVYRHMLTTVEQTAPLAEDEIQTPVLALGGAGSLGASVAEQIRQVAQNVEEGVVEDCGHFIPAEKPDELVDRFRTFASSL
ncbi:MAG: alpha/beta hydrolase [Cyanobacteria bacterium P01_D01_bin.1]